MDFKPSITGFTRVIPLVPILFELIYVAFSLIGVPQLLLTIISFPAMFILPGTLLLAVLERGIRTSALELVVKGFFISTILVVLLTSIMLTLGIALVPSNYSIIALFLIALLTIPIVIRNRAIME